MRYPCRSIAGASRTETACVATLSDPRNADRIHANDRVVYDSASGNLYYDADGSGSGAAQLIATLSGPLAAGDIAVI